MAAQTEAALPGRRKASDPSRYRLLSIREIPAWMRDNDYIRASYRPQLPSFRDCFHTAFFTLNNDSINVWSHCVGFFIFLFLSFLLLGPETSVTRHIPRIAAACSKRLPTPPDLPEFFATLKKLGLPNACLPSHPIVEPALYSLLADHRAGMLPLLCAAVFCMFASTAFHAFWIYSPKALTWLGKLDFLGISVLCCGHGITGIYHLFYCAPTLTHRYYKAIAIAEILTVCCICIPGFGSPKARPIRATVFCLLGSSVIFPIMHAGSLHEWQSYEFELAFLSAVMALSIYGIGAVIYVARFPECCRVGQHDKFFSSHQIMHIAVIFGVALHMKGCYSLMSFRLEHGCTASPILT